MEAKTGGALPWFGWGPQDKAAAKTPSGGPNSYYEVTVAAPRQGEPYLAECGDIIEALGMDFNEGTLFKAIWRSCAARTLGKLKPGHTEDGVYDAEKMSFYAARILEVRKAKRK